MQLLLNIRYNFNVTQQDQKNFILLITLWLFNFYVYSEQKLPGIYSRISLVVDWIKQESNSGTFCSDPKIKFSSESEMAASVTIDERIGEDNSKCVKLLRRFPDNAQTYAECRRRKKLRDWGWITEHLGECMSSKRVYTNFARFSCKTLWCTKMRENIREVETFFSQHCQTLTPAHCQSYSNIIKTYNSTKCDTLVLWQP